MSLIDSNGQLTKCPLCDRHSRNRPSADDNRIFKVTCDVCGTFYITDLAIDHLFASSVKPLLSAIVRRHFVFAKKPETITIDNWQVLVSQAPDKNDVPSKVRYLLGYIAHKSRFPGETVTLWGPTDYPTCFAANEEEFNYLLQYAVDAKFIEVRIHGTEYRLTPKGWQEAERIPTLDSPYAFVAMSFAKDSDNATLLRLAFEQAIQPAIEEDADYEKAIRIDKEEFLGDIVFEIIARIKECRFVIADVTDQRNGVYFEAGYAMGMGLPVIWTCYEKDMKNVHFDTSHLNHIVWNDLSKLRQDLANRILATIGRGPKKKGS